MLSLFCFFLSWCTLYTITDCSLSVAMFVSRSQLTRYYYLHQVQQWCNLNTYRVGSTCTVRDKAHLFPNPVSILYPLPCQCWKWCSSTLPRVLRHAKCNNRDCHFQVHHLTDYTHLFTITDHSIYGLSFHTHFAQYMLCDDLQWLLSCCIAIVFPVTDLVFVSRFCLNLA